MKFYNLEIFMDNYYPIPDMEHPFYITFADAIEYCEASNEKIKIFKIFDRFVRNDEKYHKQFTAKMISDLFNDFIKRESSKHALTWINRTIDVAVHYRNNYIIDYLDSMFRIYSNLESLTPEDIIKENAKVFEDRSKFIDVILREIAALPYCKYRFSTLRRVFYEIREVEKIRVDN